MKTQILATATPDEREATFAKAVEALSSGEAVALPTETVYGLAADALNVDAVVKIFAAKERPRFDPLIVHLPDCAWLGRLTSVPAADRELVDVLVQEFWPGPLTFVLPRTGVVPDLVASGLPTVAVRMSAHPVFAEIVRRLGRPLAAPSANRFGRISPTTAAHVLAELDGRIPLIIDAGPTSHGLESTIVAVRNGGMELLRSGPVTVERLSAFGELRNANAIQKLEAPGQLPSHYAPRTPLQLTGDLRPFKCGKTRLGGLSFNSQNPGGFAEFRTLSASGDLTEAAANLFRYLRELDDADVQLIVAEVVPETGIGAAIMDRLRRAAAR